MKISTIFIYLQIFLFISCSEFSLPPRIITGLVTNIDDSGAIFHGKIVSLGNAPIIEYGFVWDLEPMPYTNNAEVFSITESVKIGNFKERVSIGLNKGKTYYVRAFIRTSEGVYYGEQCSFVALGGKLPEIFTISPKTGNLTDTLVIIGDYFSSKSSNIRINNITAEIIRSKHDSIFVKIPPNLGTLKSEVLLISHNQTITSKDSFSLFEPVITNLENKQITYGDQITISGNNFLSCPSTVKVYFDSIETKFDIIDNQTIKATVPNEIDKQGFIKVKMNNLYAVSTNVYSLLPFEFYDFNPKIALTGSTITISGKNFSPILKNNIIYIGGVKAKPLTVNKHTLEVALPLQDSVVYENRSATVIAKIGNINYQHNNKLLINDKWFRKADAPIQLRHLIQPCTTCSPRTEYYYANCFVVEKLAYIGLNDNKEFWCYNYEKNIWKKLPDFPGVPRVDGVGFAYHDKIYFGTGRTGFNTYNPAVKLNDWWEYDTTNETWTRKANFIGGETSGLNAYANSSGCFVTDGFKWNRQGGTPTRVDTWRFNPTLNTWNFETIDLKGLVQNESKWIFTKVINDELFICFLDSFYGSYPSGYIYNLSSKTFKAISSFPYRVDMPNAAVSMVIGNVLYLRAPDHSFYFYDRNNNDWNYIDTNIYSELKFGIGFEIGNLGFVGLGESNHLYEFDPYR